jgi:orotidine-5'-phosphate decarboxylase
VKNLRPLIVALDVETDREARALTRRLRPHVDLFKVGPVLFLKYGGALICDLNKLGVKIFLDMKFHDIPSVVRKAIERAGEWKVYSATVHTAGGLEMMRQAAAARKRPKLWGVTVLTSLDQKDLKQQGIQRGLEEQVQHLARNAQVAGLDGVIASVRESGLVKKICGKSFQVVTPGIRLAAGGDDQKRTQTPQDAITSGADFFVMGRPIVEAKDPLAAVRDIYASLEGAQKIR